MDIGGHETCRDVMSSLFDLADSFTLHAHTADVLDGTGVNCNGSGSISDGESDGSDNVDTEVADVWVRLKPTNVPSVRDQLDSYLKAAGCIVLSG